MPLAEFRDNLRAIVAHVREAGAEELVLITPGPVHEPARVQHNQKVFAHIFLYLRTESSSSARFWLALRYLPM